MCDIYKRGLAPTARKQFGLDSTIWELQEDNDSKHTSKLTLKWKANHRIQKIDWPSMSPDLASIENVLVASQDKIKRKKVLQIVHL